MDFGSHVMINNPVFYVLSNLMIKIQYFNLCEIRCNSLHSKWNLLSSRYGVGEGNKISLVKRLLDTGIHIHP